MKSLYELYSQLGVNKSFLTYLSSNTDELYYKVIRPKMKFGKPQVVENYCKLRHLIPPVQALKVIQESICAHLQKIVLPQSMYGSIARRNNVLNALQHIENKFFLTIDLKDFFTRINNKQVHYIFIENGYCWEAARILTKLTTYKYSLPQGAPTSPVIANLSFKRTALQLMEIITGHDITFTAYLDDLTFSSRKDFKHLQPAILETIKANKFLPHPDKILYSEDKCDVTGLFVGNGKLKIHPQMLEEAETNHSIKKYVEYVQMCFKEHKLNKFKA